ADHRLEAVAEVNKRGGESRAQHGIGNHNCEGVWHCTRRAVAAGSIGAESQRPEANRLVFCVGLGLHLEDTIHQIGVTHLLGIYASNIALERTSGLLPTSHSTPTL